MKILLTQSIKGIGRAGEVKDFPQGYAQNFIIKKGYGIVATDQAVQKALSQKKHNAEEAENIKRKMVEAITKANNLNIEIKTQANEYGILFSSIHKKDILLEIKKYIQAPIEQEMLKVADPIKSTGEFTAEIKYEIYSAKINIKISKK